MTTITPCLWFDSNGLEAAEFYVSLFPDSHIDGVMPGPGGSPLMVHFTLMGSSFQALNGGPMFEFTEAVSMVVPCAELGSVLGDPDPQRAARATEAMMQMRKLDLDALRAAADGSPR